MSDKKIHIGFTLFDSRGALFRAFELSCLQSEAKKRGLRLSVIEVSTADEQVTAIERLLAQGVDGLLIRPMAISEALQAAINRALHRVPIIAIDAAIPYATATIRTDHARGQALTTEYIFEQLGYRGKIAFFGGDPVIATGRIRVESFHEVLRHHASIELVYETRIKWGLQELPREEQNAIKMREVLAAHADIDAVITCSDQDAFGALEVIAAAGLNGRILVSGFDALPAALLAISRRTMAATIRQDPRASACNALDAVLAALRNEPFPAEVLTDVCLVHAGNVAALSVQAMQVIPGMVRELADNNEIQRELQRAVISTQYNILQTMAAVSAVVSHVHDSADMLHKVVALLRQRFDLYSVGLYLQHPDETGLSLQAESCADDAGSSCHPAQWNIADDADAMACLMQHQATATGVGKDSVWALLLPLSVGDAVMGLLKLDLADDRKFNDDDILVLQAIADQIAVAIENAKLYTETERRAEALEATSQFLSSVVDNIPTPVFVKDAKTLRYISWNKAGEVVYGIPKEERIGRDAYDFFPRDIADQFTETDRAALNTGKMVEIAEEKVHTIHNGVRILHTKKIPVMRADGTPEYLVGIVQDITEQRQAAALLAEHTAELENAYVALQQNQQKLLIAEKMASLGRLAAGIAHEMNTPLSTVRSAMSELQQLITEYRVSQANPDTPLSDHYEIVCEMQKVVRMAESSAERAAGFVRGMKLQTRDLARQELTRFNAVPVIREALLLLGHALRHGGCTAALIAGSPVIELHGSPGRLIQVITNLITNAIDASAGRSGKIRLTLQEVDQQVELRVSDEGVGIPADVATRIFDPMFTTKAFGQGTGLGLTLVRDIVAGDFGGAISVESEPGMGTTFIMQFSAVVPPNVASGQYATR